MLEHIIRYTYSERAFNEDVCAADASFMFVIDGATGLGENDVMGTGDDARWFAETMKANIERRIHNADMPLSQIVREAVKEARRAYVLDVEEMNQIDMPSACIALFRVSEDRLEFFGLGDTCGIVELNDGEIIMISDEKLEALDQGVIREMQRISAERGIPMAESRPFVQDQLIHNRNLRNTQEGYYALDLRDVGVDHAVVRTWPLDQVKRIACMSDGFSQILEYPGHQDIAALLDRIEHDHLKTAEELYALQEADADCQVVPRLKKRDDATLTFARIATN